MNLLMEFVEKTNQTRFRVSKRELKTSPLARLAVKGMPMEKENSRYSYFVADGNYLRDKVFKGGRWIDA